MKSISVINAYLEQYGILWENNKSVADKIFNAIKDESETDLKQMTITEWNGDNTSKNKIF